MASLYGSSVSYQHYSEALNKQKRAQRLQHASVNAFDLDVVVEELRTLSIPSTDTTAVYQYNVDSNFVNNSFNNSNEFPVNKKNDIIDSESTSKSNSFHREPSSQSSPDKHNCLYSYSPLDARVLAVVKNGKVVSSSCKVLPDDNIGLILSATNFYSTGGGQISDIGDILASSSSPKNRMTFRVKDVESVEGYTIHWCSVAEEQDIDVGCDVVCCIDEHNRLACSQHHTATHLLLAAMRQHTREF